MIAFLRQRSALHCISRRISAAALLAAFFCLSAIIPLHAAEGLPEIQQLFRQGQHTQALDKVNAYLNGRPKDAQGRFLKGLILAELKRSDEAIVAFTQLTVDYPELPEPYNNLAVLYAQQKQYDRARVALEMAIRTHPSYAVAYENLGDVYAKLASQAYNKALQLDTSNAAAQNKLALIQDLVSAPARPQTAPTPPAAPPPTQVASTAPSATPTANPPTAATTPVPTPIPPKTPPAEGIKPASGDDAAEVGKTIAAWAAAWSQKDVKAYLGFYAPDFKTPKGVRRKTWETEREARISRPDWIKVSYSAPEIQVDGNQATARFQQNYQASNFKSSSTKVLTLTRSGAVWLILAEESN